MTRVLVFVCVLTLLIVLSHYISKATRYEQLSQYQQAQIEKQLEHAKTVDRVLAELETQIFDLNELSKEREEEFKNALKNNKCANERVPASVANELRERANRLR